MTIRSPLARHSLRLITVLTGFLVLGTFVLLARSCADHELRTMPDHERRALYARTIETLRTTCAQPIGPTVADHCREQAEFVERLPECDDACHELARRTNRRPTR